MPSQHGQRRASCSSREGIGSSLSGPSVAGSGGTVREDDMNAIDAVLDAHPQPAASNGDAARACIAACQTCATVCTTCADACLHEKDVASLRDCIRLDLDCADICETTARLLARASHTDAATLRLQVRACEQACRTCETECAKHARHMEHCRVCAEACRACADACRDMAAAIVA